MTLSAQDALSHHGPIAEYPELYINGAWLAPVDGEIIDSIVSVVSTRGTELRFS